MELDKELINKIKIIPLLDTLKLENISDKEYFSEKFNGYISNSRLGLLKTKGAKVFFEGIPQVYNPSFITGELLHQQVLQPETFELIGEVFKPTAKAGLMADKLYKIYKLNGTTPSDDEIKSASYIIGYYKDKLTPNRLNEFKQKAEPYWRDRYIFEQKNPPSGFNERIYTDKNNYDIVSNCLKSLNENKDIQKLLHPEGITENPYSANEQTILLDVEINIPGYESKVYKLKSKLDNFTIDKEGNVITVNDLKTTSKLAKDFDPSYFSYQRELGMYSYLLKLCAKKFFNLDKPTINGNFLVVSIIPEYNSLVYPMTPKLYKQGFCEFVYLLKAAAYFNIVKGYEFQ